MKNRKKQLMKIGAVIAVIAVAGIAGGVVIYKCANRFDLTVAGDPISKEEYVNCMNSVEYDTKMQIQQDYDAVYGRISGKSNTTDNTAMRSSPGIQ